MEGSSVGSLAGVGEDVPERNMSRFLRSIDVGLIKDTAEDKQQ